MNEFNIIDHFFQNKTPHHPDILLGIGDDAAILGLASDQTLVYTTDTLVNDIHFPTNTHPFDIGYKALAVNLSDLAAMGATPYAISLALTLPHAQLDWLQAFSDGFFSLANRFRVQLIGGDLTRGPLTITIGAFGTLPRGKALLRSNAKPNDDIYVTGSLGDASCALAMLQHKVTVDPLHQASLLPKLYHPEPRLTLGKDLLNTAHACIDISDGFIADLRHILKASQVGAMIHVHQLPLSTTLKQAVSLEQAIAFALNGGDDYELCFTAPNTQRDTIMALTIKAGCSITRIGEITATPDLSLLDQQGHPYHASLHGYQHF